MAKIPVHDVTMLNDTLVFNDFRGHNGLSGIGEECHRKLQYDHYWAYRKFVSARINRLLTFGTIMEEIIIRDIESLGFTVTDRQLEIVATAGHWLGHIDGIASRDGQRFLLELKTHNDSNFKDVRKNGVKKSKPRHYAQMQSYMSYTGLKIALYVAYNKDTSEYYLEDVHFDEEFAAELVRKELEILVAEELLPRIGNNNITWFACKQCDARDVCFSRAKVRKTCRSCSAVEIQNGGMWYCSVKGTYLSESNQRAACDLYKISPLFEV